MRLPSTNYLSGYNDPAPPLYVAHVFVSHRKMLHLQRPQPAVEPPAPCLGMGNVQKAKHGYLYPIIPHPILVEETSQILPPSHLLTDFKNLIEFARWIHLVKWRVSWADLLCGWNITSPVGWDGHWHGGIVGNVTIVCRSIQKQPFYFFLPRYPKGWPTKRTSGRKAVTGKWTAAKQRNQCLQNQVEKNTGMTNKSLSWQAKFETVNGEPSVCSIAVYHFSDQTGCLLIA